MSASCGGVKVIDDDVASDDGRRRVVRLVRFLRILRMASELASWNFVWWACQSRCFFLMTGGMGTRTFLILRMKRLSRRNVSNACRLCLSLNLPCAINPR